MALCAFHRALRKSAVPETIQTKKVERIVGTDELPNKERALTGAITPPVGLVRRARPGHDRVRVRE